MSRRTERVAEQIQAEVADILLREVEDPRVRGVTVTGVEVSPDLHYAKVFWVASGPESVRRQKAAGLESIKGLVRREVGRRIRLKTVPEIRFIYDESLDRAARIDEILRGLAPARPVEGGEGGEPGEGGGPRAKADEADGTEEADRKSGPEPRKGG